MRFAQSYGRIEGEITCIIICDDNEEVLALNQFVYDFEVKPQASELPLKSDLCPDCDGKGEVYPDIEGYSEGQLDNMGKECEGCKGTGSL